MIFNFKTDYILEDERVILSPLESKHIENLLTFSENEPEIWKFSLIQASGKENLKHYIDLALKAKDKETEYPFVVFDKKSNRFAGSTRFYDIQLQNKTLQLGYTWYGKEFQGTGLNKHCKYLLLEFAFEKMQVERVEFRADANNEKSIAAMKSIGCTVEGILRKNVKKPEGRRRDSIILSILKDEWNQQVKQNLKNKL